MSDHDDEHRPVRRVLWARLLLILPFVAMLWVSSYNSAEPTVAGIPFFYWYQLLWILIGAVLIAFVYLLER
jgi:cell division protein FtsW (lipid II flippase)